MDVTAEIRMRIISTRTPGRIDIVISTARRMPALDLPSRQCCVPTEGEQTSRQLDNRSDGAQQPRYKAAECFPRGVYPQHACLNRCLAGEPDLVIQFSIQQPPMGSNFRACCISWSASKPQPWPMRIDIYDSGKLFEAQIAETMPAEG